MLTGVPRRVGRQLLSAGIIAAGAIGCGAQRFTIADTFPVGSYASPWVLRDQVWDGSFEEASDALGEEAAQWGTFDPEHVWLAVYQHDAHPTQKLTVRAFAFTSADHARHAFQRFLPPHARELEAGDEGCWTADGVLVRWGRMVFDIFGNDPSSFASPEQAVYLLACIEKRMPADLPDAP